MKCKGQIYTENTGLYLDRSEYDTPGSIRGCRCPDCERVRRIHKAASALGSLGGSVKSERKTLAVRENGRKGGRPSSKAVAETYRGQCDKCGLIGDWKQYEDGTYQKKCEHCGSTRGWSKVL